MSADVNASTIIGAELAMARRSRAYKGISYYGYNVNVYAPGELAINYSVAKPDDAEELAAILLAWAKKTRELDVD